MFGTYIEVKNDTPEVFQADESAGCEGGVCKIDYTFIKRLRDRRDGQACSETSRIVQAVVTELPFAG